MIKTRPVLIVTAAVPAQLLVSWIELRIILSPAAHNLNGGLR